MAITITADLIREALDKNFPGHILSRGYKYFQRGAVKDVEQHPDLFKAKVDGSKGRGYLVKVDFVFGRLTTNCSCPFDGHCKHEAAVLYKIRESLMQNKGTSRGRVTKPQAKTGLALPDGRTGTFRALPLGKADLETIVSEVGVARFQGMRGFQPFEGTLSADGVLTIQSCLPRYYGRQQKNEIVLKKAAGAILIKCNTCNEKTNRLCEHQTTLLEQSAEALQRSGFLAPGFEVEALVALAAKKTGVSPEALFKYYQIVFLPNGFGYKPNKENIYDATWISSAQKSLERVRSSQAERKERLEQQLAQGRAEKVAFLWMQEPYGYQQMGWLQFMQGSGLKTKAGIRSSDRKVTDMPLGFARPQMDLARQLYFYFQDAEPVQHFQPIQALLEEHIDTLNEVYQYVSTSRSLRASDLHLVKFHPTPLEAKFSFKKVDGLVAIVRQVLVDGEPFSYQKVLFSNGIFCATTTTAYLFPNAEFERFMDFFSGGDTIYVPTAELKTLTALIADFGKHFDTTVEEGLVLPEQTLRDPDFQILLRELGEFIVFEPRLSYGEYSANAFQEDDFFMDDYLYKVEESDRRFLAEFLITAHPDFEHSVQLQDFVYLPINKMLDNYWFLHFNEACEAAGIALLGQKDLSKFKYSKHKAATFTHVKSGIDWFEVDMGVSFGKEKVKTADWIRALRNQESFVTLKDGTLGILPEEWLTQAKKVLAVADLEKGELKISKYRFNIIEELFEDLDDTEILRELEQKKKRLAQLETGKQYSLPATINAELRPYQKHGFAWLKFLEESGFGGILADDMGLGKTLQVLALLADQQGQPTSLIVVPRSLLFNWAAEIDKFCPSLSYVIHHGPTRTRDLEELARHDLLITTYGTAASDISLLQTFDFNYIVLDESQAIKNPASKRYKAMRLLRSRNKIAMTGTPIENNTFDLYAQLSFCSPGLLGTQSSFKQNFAMPIDNERDKEAADLLRKMIHPFVLRRTKEQVAQDLPDKTETVIYCEMGNAQRKLYENLKRKIKEDIEAELEEKGFEKSKFKMLDGLLRLRQMCNSPLLLNQSFKGQHAQSVKIDVLLQNLTEELDQHSALVFSQFVGFLTLVRRELDKRGIKYAYLDGSTTKRQEQVEKFMQKDEVRIFLISLKAGNTGLNLTKADYVYLLDPWWNPAVEAQAIDRTHRIGQDKNIFAYKLICKDSIEEKILKLQERKKEISTEIIRTDENAFKSLSKDDLLDLFR